MNRQLALSYRLLLTGLLLFAIALTTSSPAQAQDVQTISFDEAISIAMRQNVALRQAANSMEAQSAQVMAAKANFLPDLSLFLQPSQRFGTTFDQNTGGFVSSKTNTFSGQIGTNINVFNGFADVSALDRARSNYAASDYQYERARQTVVFNVVSNFLQVISDREAITIQQENMESQQQQLQQIEEFTRVGQRPISDLYQQQATAAQAEAQLLTAERAYQLSQTRLIQVLQLDPFGNYEFTAPEVEEGTLVPQTYDLTTLLTEAFSRRTDLQAQEAQIDAAQANIRVARSNYFPSVGFGANMNSSFSNSLKDQTGETVSFSDQFFDQRRTQGLGFNINIPLFSRLQTRNQVQQARVQYENTRLGLESLRQDIALQVRQAYLDYETAEKQLDVAEKQFRAAEQALEAAQERYNLNMSTLVELTQARAAFVQGASNRSSARYSFLFQEKLIEYYTGVLDPTSTLSQ